ncbi:DUF3368 domain-containing protein [Catalinimonas alkaloidigena]|uniref:DUF3368 domain-containing protein n=1 Tax=Catalinimonas alkaloidigena TaxID=1075417 RepID=UPI002405C760|nr:DUF3368 domain-containing protein [Catalinimonas alkaloidigena]
MLEKVYGKIGITEVVAKEFNRPIPEWIDIYSLKTSLPASLKNALDPGEASAIALTKEYPNSLLIIDELKGRRVAKALGIEITGSLGVILAAKNKGLIPTVLPIIEKIKQTNFRLSDTLIQKFLVKAGEQNH